MAGISLKPFRQTPGLCGPASLKIALSAFGIDKTEEELARHARASQDRGTDHAGLAEAARIIGVLAHERSNASMDDVRVFLLQGIPVIVGFWDEGETGDDHYAVAFDVDEEHIFLMDPQRDGGIRVMPIEDFESVWFDLDGPENVRVERWMMGIEEGV